MILVDEAVPWYLQPGWWAMGVSTLSLAVSITVAVLTGRSRGWRRAYLSVQKIDSDLRAVSARLDEQITPEAVGNLWTPAFDANLHALRGSIKSLSDRKMRRHIATLVEKLERLRGKGRPARAVNGVPQPLSAEQRGLMKEAVAANDRLTTRIQKASRKGVA